MRTHDMDMTCGSLPKKIIQYTLPLILTNLLQAMFNLADIAVVGRFAGSIALGSVGSTTMLIFLAIGILIGLAGGVNAVTARFAGAKDSSGISHCVHTGLLILLFSGVLLVLCGFLFSKSALTLLGTKPELISGAQTYLTIYLLGSPALALYNHGNAVLSAIGDTRRPLIYLLVSGMINVALNLLFVVFFHLDVAGVALASIISQYIAAFLILRHLFTCRQSYGLSLRELRMNRSIALHILRIGIPGAIQYSLFSIANLFIQSAVNSFDHVVVEGHSAAANADSIVYDVMAAFYTACTSFIGQNLGAGKRDRIRKTYFYTLLFSFLAGAILGGLLVVFRKPFLHLFTTDPDVVYYGSIRLVIMGCSYCISAFMDNASAAARGLGKSVIPTVIIILGTVVYRIVWVYTIFAHYHTLPSLYLVFGTAWIFTAILGNIYLVYAYRHTVIPKDAE